MNDQLVIPSWNKDSKFALNFNKFICWPLGIWPLDYNSAFSNFRMVYALVSQIWFMYVQIAPAYLNCGNASDVVDYVMMTTCAFMTISKIIAYRIHMNKIRPVFLSAMNDWLSVDDRSNRDIMMKFAKTGRFVFKLQIGTCYVSNTLIIIGALPFLIPPIAINDTLANMSDTTEMAIARELPVKSGCLFRNYGDAIYVFFYVYEIIMINITAHGQVGCDVFLFSLLMHLCGQIELIKKELRAIAVTPENSAESENKISEFVKKHVQVLELARAVKLTASGMLVIQLLCNAGLNLMIGLRVIMALQNHLIVDAIRLICAFGVLMLQLYLVSYASDRLSSQSESIVEALYEIQWYELPPKLQKTLYFVAMRANTPINLLAGQFYTLNVENFKNTLKASFSYFSIMRVMFED